MTAANIAFEIGAFARAEGLGQVFAQDTGFKIARDPDTVRAPDVAFVSRERLADDVLPGFSCRLAAVLTMADLRAHHRE